MSWQWHLSLGLTFMLDPLSAAQGGGLPAQGQWRRGWVLFHLPMVGGGKDRRCRRVGGHCPHCQCRGRGWKPLSMAQESALSTKIACLLSLPTTEVRCNTILRSNNQLTGKWPKTNKAADAGNGNNNKEKGDREEGLKLGSWRFQFKFHQKHHLYVE